MPIAKSKHTLFKIQIKHFISYSINYTNLILFTPKQPSIKCSYHSIK